MLQVVPSAAQLCRRDMLSSLMHITHPSMGILPNRVLHAYLNQPWRIHCAPLETIKQSTWQVQSPRAVFDIWCVLFSYQEVCNEVSGRIHVSCDHSDRDDDTGCLRHGD